MRFQPSLTALFFTIDAVATDIVVLASGQGPNDNLGIVAITGIGFLGIGWLTLLNSYYPKLGCRRGLSWSDRRDFVRYLHDSFPRPMRQMATIQIAFAMIWNIGVFATWLLA